MKDPVFTGSSTAIVTPFLNGNVDYTSLAGIIDMQMIAGTAALTVCGTTGESSSMGDYERTDVLRFCRKRCPSAKLIAGAGSNSTSHALELSLAAQDAGADALLLVTPYYNKATQAGLIKHYEYIADRVSIPIILYNVPSRTGVSFTAETYGVLSRHPMINAVKEASGDMNLTKSAMALCGDELNIYTGNDENTVPMMALGAKGVISVAANIIPDVMRCMTQLCLQSRFDEASSLQIRYNDLIRALFLEVNPIPVKTAMSMMGICSDEMRLPMCAMGEINRARLAEIMQKHGMI